MTRQGHGWHLPSEITGPFLTTLRRKALRAGVWFPLLQSTERAIVDLTIRYVERIHSAALATVLARVVGKVFRVLRLGMWGPIEAIGRPLAERLAKVAVSWGHPTAHLWAEDRAFIRLLGLTSHGGTQGGRSH
jgi:hypothetical protein